jgi:hypothetical protein
MAKADKITNMKLNLSKMALTNCDSQSAARISAKIYLTVAFTIIASAGVAYPAENQADITFNSSNPEADPTAFASSYFGLILNQNQPWSYGTTTWSKGGPSWGGEYRFFYKDSWTLSLSGEFKKLEDLTHTDKNIFTFSQETMRLVRLYHPWYLAAGGKFSYYIPVRQISIPYERDQSRAIDTGAAISVATIWITGPHLTTMLSANRWRSLSTTKKQGVELMATALVAIR